MAKIEYVGKKASKRDNVAGTDTFWSCKGDVQEVANPDAVAKLIVHTDTWRLVADKADKAAKPVVTPPTKKEEQEEPDLPPIANFARMGKDAIEAYARAHLGYEVDQRKSLKDIRDVAKKTYDRICAVAG